MSSPIQDWQLQARDGKLLLGLSLGFAVLDIESDRSTLTACLKLLESPSRGESTRMGTFGPYEITLNHNLDDTVSIFIDGPEFELQRTQSAAVFPDKIGLCSILREIEAGCENR